MIIDRLKRYFSYNKKPSDNACTYIDNYVCRYLGYYSPINTDNYSI